MAGSITQHPATEPGAEWKLGREWELQIGGKIVPVVWKVILKSWTKFEAFVLSQC